VYQISIAPIQGQEWVVSSGRYRVVGANVFTHFEETILMLRTTSSMVKIMISGYNKTEDIFDLDANIHTSNIVFSFVHYLVWFFIHRRPTILGGEFNSLAYCEPWIIIPQIVKL
jgi:hypothetical protein